MIPILFWSSGNLFFGNVDSSVRLNINFFLSNSVKNVEFQRNMSFYNSDLTISDSNNGIFFNKLGIKKALADPVS